MSVIDICKTNGIIVQETEPSIYKNITVNNLVNIDLLKRSINDCTLFVSEPLKRQATKQGYSTVVAKVYYIMLGTEDKERIKQLYACVKKEYPKVYISKFKDLKDIGNDVLTIYSPAEVGRR